jgi:hypothetical protein
MQGSLFLREFPAEETTMSEVKHRIVETSGIHMHLAEQGTGPLVVLCHGFDVVKF